jgi:aminoglycoside phosphotransferase (APT) family kinase protein
MSNLNEATQATSARAEGELNTSRLEPVIREFTSAQRVSIDNCRRLSGGAIQENWLLEVRLQGGPWAGTHRWVLRTDAASAVQASLSRAQEFAVLSVAYQARVKVPRPLWLCDDPGVLGRTFFLMEMIPGVAAGHVLTGKTVVAARNARLAKELGANLARLHGIEPPRAELGFLPMPEGSPALAAISAYRNFLDTLGQAFPVLEWGLRWCQLNAPQQASVCLIHRDYRTGNYLAHEGELTGVLDWEFAGWGDAREDLGWFTARCWRFARPDLEAGGIGRLEDFLAGYESQSQRRLDRHELVYWQVMATLRWAIIALQQAERHLSGEETSLELALTGRLVPELELDILRLTGGLDR